MTSETDNTNKPSVTEAITSIAEQTPKVEVTSEEITESFRAAAERERATLESLNQGKRLPLEARSNKDVNEAFGIEPPEGPLGIFAAYEERAKRYDEMASGIETGDPDAIRLGIRITDIQLGVAEDYIEYYEEEKQKELNRKDGPENQQRYEDLGTEISLMEDELETLPENSPLLKGLGEKFILDKTREREGLRSYHNNHLLKQHNERADLYKATKSTLQGMLPTQNN